MSVAANMEAQSKDILGTVTLRNEDKVETYL